MSRSYPAAAALLATALCCGPLLASPQGPSPAAAEQYTLRYKFQAGDTLRWNVVHRCRIRSTVSETTQTAETTTASVKAWRVHEVRPDGAAVFEHLVESVDMRHKLSGRDEVRYNSRTNPVPPPGFESLAQSVGVPLCLVTMDVRGKVLARKRNPVKAAVPSDGDMTIRLPDGPVSVGQQWSYPRDLEVPMPGGGGPKRIKARQVYTLASVKTGVATIRTETQILTPIHDPALASQLIQYETSGSVRFDVDAGRILSRETEVDKGVVGFRGEASSVHYLSRSTEEFLPAETKVAADSQHTMN
jgi:hypothetical protein